MINRRSSQCATFCGLAAFAAAVLALLGWLLGAPLLKSMLPDFVAMNPLTAIALAGAGGSLWLLRSRQTTGLQRRLAYGAATGMIVVGGLKLLEYAGITALHLDRLLFTTALGSNQIAPNTAVCLILIGLSLLTIDTLTRRGFWVAQVPAFITAAISLLSLVGYGYGAEMLYYVAYIPMALNTAIVFLILSLGILLSRADRGFAAVLLASGPGGVMARRLLPATIGIPVSLGWLRLVGEDMGLYDTEFGAAIMVAATVMLFVVAIGWIAGALSRSDAQRQQATEELERTSQEIFDLYNLAPCGYHSVDSSGTFVAINDTELAWLGYTRDEVVGKLRLTDLITKDMQAMFQRSFAAFKRTGHVKDLELNLVRKDGSALPVILNATAIYDQAGNYHSSRSTLFDATDKRQAEEAIRLLNGQLECRVRERTQELAVANADLVQKNRENEMFVYSVSHDLRSPLVNLQGFSNELELVCGELRNILSATDVPPQIAQQSLGLVDGEMPRCIRFIQTGVGRLSGIIDALLRLSRAGRVDYQHANVDLAGTVCRIVESMSSTIYEKAATIDICDLRPALGDATALEQVFANLIGNALNYLDPARQGHIEIGELEAEDLERDHAQFNVYYVKDNGLGIAEAYHSKVFQALKRLHPDAAKGEGMGLAIVRRIVERHGGEIWFESCEHKGSTFFVRLPRPPDHNKRNIKSELSPRKSECGI